MRKQAGTIVAVSSGCFSAWDGNSHAFAGSNANAGSARLTVAKVNSVKVSALDLALEFQQAYSRRVQYGGLKPEDIEELRSDALDALIEDALILDAAKKAGYVANQVVVDSAYEADKAYFQTNGNSCQLVANWGGYQEELQGIPWSTADYWELSLCSKACRSDRGRDQRGIRQDCGNSA